MRAGRQRCLKTSVECPEMRRSQWKDFLKICCACGPMRTMTTPARCFVVLCAFTIVLPPSRPAVAAEGAGLTRLPRTNLLLYRQEDGNVAPVRGLADWQKRRAAILDGMQQISGPLPGREKRCPLDPQVSDEVDCGGYLRRLLTYASEA